MSGCDGCAYRGGEDCPLETDRSGNFFCPNGRLDSKQAEDQTEKERMIHGEG